MKTLRYVISLALILFWSTSVWARDDGGQKYQAPAEIVASLPKVCWWFYMDNVPDTPEYNIRANCGAYSNHYCPGLVNMKQAETTKNKQERLQQLKSAKVNMEYTLHFVTGYPECSVLSAARMNLEVLKFQIELLQSQMQKR